MPALQHADPRLLKKILRAFLISCDVHQIPEQPVLILLDQPVQQLRVALPQSLRDGLRLVGHQRREQQRIRPRQSSKNSPPANHRARIGISSRHSILYTAHPSKKTHPRYLVAPANLGISAFASYALGLSTTLRSVLN